MNNIIDIIQINSTIEKLIGRQIVDNCYYRLMRYCKIIKVSDGILLYNLVTGTIILIEKGLSLEDLLIEKNKKLIEEWYFVPESFSEKDWCRNIQNQVRVRNSNGYFSRYVIITTFDCNARCFYCFEHGTEKITMTKDTADAIIGFITKQYYGKEVKISWFGGEPLCNVELIRYISDGLNSNGVRFHSIMHTNGYLFSDNLIAEAVNSWNLKEVNITIDGTEKNYNKIKNYKYDDISPFKTVIANIEHLCKSRIPVRIRIHVGTQNNDDLLQLIDYLHKKFSCYESFHIYPRCFYPNSVPSIICDNRKIEGCFNRIRNRLTELGYQRPQILKSRITAYSCMADNNNSIVITPDGQLSKCEHVTDNSIVGNIFDGVTDLEKMKIWTIRAEEPGCEFCDLLPICNELKSCPSRESCTEFKKNRKIYWIIKDVLNTYSCWKRENSIEI